MSASLGPAVFLDKDGTLVEDVPYNADPALIRLVRGAGPALRRLQDAGFALHVVTNQSGVARGMFPADALVDVERKVRELLAVFDVTLAGFHACPHHPEGSVARYSRECECRKPKPGLLLSAAREQGLDLTRSWMVGDILDDIEAGNRAGCRSVLVDNGGETEWRGGEYRRPLLSVRNLEEAAATILARPHNRRESTCNVTCSN